MIASGYLVLQNGVDYELKYWTVPRSLTPLLKYHGDRASGILVLAPAYVEQAGMNVVSLCSINNPNLRASDVPNGAKVLGEINSVVSGVNGVPITLDTFVGKLSMEQIEKAKGSIARLHVKQPANHSVEGD